MLLQTKWEIYFPIVVNCLLSAMMFVFTLRLIPKLVDMFLKANIFGIDVNKKERNKIPEAFGVVIGCMYLITLFIFIPIPFGREIVETSYFPHHEFVKFLAALLSICCMLLLGFADDILDLRWRHKLLLPTVASLPLLMVYYVTFNVTNVIVPKPLRHWFGMSVDLGPLYYLYMGMLAVFCTNAINILAGVNGLEAGQSVVIGISILVFNCIELNGTQWEAHLFSIYLVLPFVATSLALLKYNWYPSKVFVGDTFCYFAGMTFAVVGILGHFSKTMLLFFIPQIFNFVYSTPQLFRIVPCPRHRMPRLNKNGDLEISVASVPKDEIGSLGHLILWIIKLLHVGHVVESEKLYEFSNLTLINLVLVWFGPMKEPTLTSLLLVIQVVGTIIAFCIRYPLASLFYDIVQ